MVGTTPGNLADENTRVYNQSPFLLCAVSSMSRARLPLGYDFASPSPDLVGYWRAYVPNAGTFYIRRVDGLWHAMFGSESLGSYPNPAEAHRALISGLTARPASGIDPSQLKLLPDLSAWPFYTGAAQLARAEQAAPAGSASGSTWHFLRDDETAPSKWTWRRMRIDGTIEQTSEPHLEFGSVIANAVEKGFKPKHDAYVVIAGEMYTHFRPGESPITVPPDRGPRSPFVEAPNEAERAAANLNDALKPNR